ncbi:MAG: mannitol-1-phosphate 5-dehydrogenase [Candidatus Omnitrophica bacterium]|nr:mannitol-1-phosphate 5-dehydrogenase [Candidatus Omnitrophota bacterium]MCM8777091.1 mannitol-1-phosphate 5-dehydrogenase [Candidatus Omnitrophota bacterium]
MEDKKEVVIFGAGQIGRGFIGDICHSSGYHLVFVDVVEEVVKLLNKEKAYLLWLLDNDRKEEKIITGISAISFSEKDRVIEAIVKTDIAFTAVGANNLKSLAPLLAEGINRKAEQFPDSYLNVIICENLLGSSEILKKEIKKYLSQNGSYFLEQRTGLIESVVSRMVAPLSEEMKKKYPLLVTVEPYNILPVEKNKFKGGGPSIRGLYPVEDLFPYEELKLFIHNLSHACLAYMGYIKGYTYIWEAIEDPDIRAIFDGVVSETRASLIKKHNFEISEIDGYIKDLIKRFGNRLLNDTVFRVGRDPLRKIGPNDRIAGAINLCLSQGVYPENICFVMALSLCYNYPDDKSAIEMQALIKEKGIEFLLKEVSCIKDAEIIERIKKYYWQVKSESSSFKTT